MRIPEGRPLSFLIALALVLATLAVYFQAVGHPFITLDDEQYILDNPAVTGGLSGKGIAWAFTSTYAFNWHPVTWISHMLDVELFGLDAGMHHLVNVLLHAANAALLFAVLLGMTGAPWRSGFAAALFALHPLHVESVAWVAERKDVLSTLFLFLTLLAWLRYTQRRKAGWFLGALALFALGLLSKPMLVTLPFLLLLLDAWPLGRLAGAQAIGLRRALLEKVPFAVLAGASGVLTYLVQQKGGAIGPSEIFPLGVRIANSVVSYADYLIKTFWPSPLAVFYPHPGASLPAWKIAGAGLLLAAVSVPAILSWRRRPYLTVGWLWYLGTLVPVIGLVQIGRQGSADRYTYIPLIGLFLMAAWGIPELFERWRLKPRALAAAAVAVLVACGALSFRQLGFWRSSERLFTHAIAVTRDNWMAHHSLGAVLIREGKAEEAVNHYYEALRIMPEDPRLHANLSVALLALGRPAEGYSHYLEAQRIQKRLQGIYFR